MDYDGDSSGHVHDRYSHRTGPDTDGRRPPPRPHPPNYGPTSQAYNVGINVGDESDPEPPADYDMDETEDNPLNGHVLTPYDPHDGGPPYDPQVGKPRVGGDLHSVSLEMHDMTDNGTARNLPGTMNRGDHRLFTLRHRRDASRNGYEYFKQLKQQISRGFEDNVDSQSVGSLHFEDLREARQFLATIRVRRKKSSAKRNSATDTVEVLLPGDESPVGGDEEDDAYEEVGLPSTRQKTKGLAERLILARQEKSMREQSRNARAAVEASETRGLIYYLKQCVRGCKSVFEGITDVWYRLNFWSQQFREIEGHFGIATSTYFRFTRWLVNLNFVVFFLYLCFIYIPQLSYNSLYEFLTPSNVTSSGDFYETMVRCSKTYTEKAHNKSTNRNWLTFLNIAQGTGFLENTMLFYGYYTNLTFSIAGEKRPSDMRYNMGLGYLLTVGFSFIVVFIMIVKNSSTTIKETVIDFDNKIFPMYTNATFGGWDYCINSEKMAIYKQRIIYNEFKATLLEVKMKRVRDNRSTKEKSRLYLKRFVINLVVLALLAGAFYTIYVTTDFLIRNQTENLSDILFLLINYLPSIVISMLNAVIPEIFLALSTVEQYSNSFATHITIVRAVFLRLSSVWVLIVSLYYRLQYQGRKPFNCPEENKYNVTRCCGNALWESIIENDQLERGTVQCWESYVGQQFYKLCITDFISVTLIVLAIKIPRRIIHHHFQHKFWIVKKFGRSKFDLPLQVLDIVYSQTVCWMGMFFTPLLPALTFVKVFYFFFLKKFELLSVAEAPQIAYRASRSYSFFQTVLLLSFIVISCLLGYMIGNLQPSMSCGPFRIYSKPDFVMFDVITNEINSWPSVPQGIIKYFGTIGFYVPAFLIALLSIYYYLAVTAGYKKMEELLKEQLKLEAHDKQFLLARVDEIIKKGQLEAPQIVTK